MWILDSQNLKNYISKKIYRCDLPKTFEFSRVPPPSLLDSVHNFDKFRKKSIPNQQPPVIKLATKPHGKQHWQFALFPSLALP